MSIESKMAVLQGYQIPPIYSNTQNTESAQPQNNQDGGNPSPVQEYFGQVGENVQISNQAATMQGQSPVTEVQGSTEINEATAPDDSPTAAGSQAQAMTAYARMQESSQPEPPLQPQPLQSEVGTETQPTTGRPTSEPATTGGNQATTPKISQQPTANSGLNNETAPAAETSQIQNSGYAGMSTGVASYTATAAAGNASMPGAILGAGLMG